MRRKYTVIFEKGPTSVGAYVPDLPGCVAVGDDIADARELIAEAMEAHLAAMAEDGDCIPEPSSVAEEVEIALAEFHSA